MLAVDPFNEALGTIGQAGILGALLVMALFGIYWFVKRFDGITTQFIDHLRTTSVREVEVLAKVSMNLDKLTEAVHSLDIHNQSCHDEMMDEIKLRTPSENGHTTPNPNTKKKYYRKSTQ